MNPYKLVHSIFLFVGAVLVASAAYALLLATCEEEWCFLFEAQKIWRTSDFAECAARGFPVTEGDPRVCTAGRKAFTEDLQR